MPVGVIRTGLLSTVIAKMHSRKVLQKVLVPKAKNQGMKMEEKKGYQRCLLFGMRVLDISVAKMSFKTCYLNKADAG